MTQEVDDPRRHEIRCNDCGKFLAFADLCFSKHHFQPLSEMGPEESWWSCPSCRDDYGGRDQKGQRA